jgi:hypothetical protein
LPPALRTSMESRLGADFRDVRVHTGSIAEKSAEALDARAYTAGRDIVFNRAEFAPDTHAGKTLLAHELAHVVQQSRGGKPPAGAHSRSLEQSAVQAASRAVAGATTEVAGASAVGVSRAPKKANPIELPQQNVEMPWQPGKKGSNRMGYKRSAPWFFRRFRDANPHAISPANRAHINKGRVPVVDETWAKAFPDHAGYKGQKLVHHHTGHGGTTVPLPQDLHEAHKVFHADVQDVSKVKTGEPLPPKRAPGTTQKLVNDLTKKGTIRGQGISASRPPKLKVDPATQVAALPPSQRGRAKVDTANVDPKTGVAKKGSGRKGGVGQKSAPGKGSQTGAGKQSAGRGRGRAAGGPKRPTGGRAGAGKAASAKKAGGRTSAKTPVKSASPRGPRTAAPKGPRVPQPQAPSAPLEPVKSAPAPTPQTPDAPHTAKPTPAPHAQGPSAPTGEPSIKPQTPIGEPKPVPQSPGGEPHVTKPADPHPTPAAKPTPPTPKADIHTPDGKIQVKGKAPTPHVPGEVHVPHAPGGASPHVPGGKAPVRALGKLGKAGKVGGPALAIGAGIYGTAKDLQDGQKVPEAVLGNTAQTAVGLSGIGGPADMAINLVNMGVQMSGAPPEVKEGTGLLADVTPSTFGGNAAKQFARGAYNIATGDQKALDKQVDEMQRGKAGTPLQGYALWATEIVPDLASGKDPLEVFNSAASKINNKTLEKAGNYLGDETYQFINKDLPEFAEFVGKDVDAAKEKLKGAGSSAKKGLKSAWNYMTEW